MVRKPLGRGLDALIQSTEPVTPAEPGASTLATIPLDCVAPAPFQPRRHFDPESLEELAQAIRSQGIVEPLIVRPAPDRADGARYELIAGERRLRAARSAGLSEVPVLVRDLDDRAALEMSLVENLVREDLSPIEEARAFQRLNREFGLSHEEVASRIGKSRPHVSNTVRLLELPPDVVSMLERGELSAGQARPLLGLPTSDAQIQAARRIVSGGVSARGAEEIAQAHRRRNGRSMRGASDPNLAALAEGLQRALKRKVRILKRRGKTPGRIEIEYYDDNDLTTLAETIVASGRIQNQAGA
jgi:ParB family transcriptional regulator, chromosome partitioning protein